MNKNYKSEYHEKIAELIAAGKSRTEIAEYFGVKPDTITHKLNAMKKAGEIGNIDFLCERRIKKWTIQKR